MKRNVLPAGFLDAPELGQVSVITEPGHEQRYPPRGGAVGCLRSDCRCSDELVDRLRHVIATGADDREAAHRAVTAASLITFEMHEEREEMAWR